MNIFVPGRICLFGEHSDWAGGYRRINADIEKGYTLICGTDQGIHAEVSAHPTLLVTGFVGVPIPPLQSLAIPIFDMILFPTFVGLAIARRHNPQSHKRWILLATINLITAAIAR